eukprot:102977-Prorocentrum_lima.AAC.1
MEIDGTSSLKREGEDNMKVAAAKARLNKSGNGTGGADSDAGSASSSFVNVPMDTLLASFRK